MSIIITACVAWLLAQAIKIIIELIKTKKLNPSLLIASGGMPSSHTAFVAATTTKIALLDGVYSTSFGAAVIFSLVIMYDAVGVRQSVGIQAKALNELNAKLFDATNFDYNIIKEVCGHNIFEVSVGLMLGILVGLFLL